MPYHYPHSQSAQSFTGETRIPNDPGLIAQLYLLLEGYEELEQVLDYDFTRARMAIRARDGGANVFGKFELESAKYSSNRVFHADLENNKTMPKRKFDGILALGVFPHIKKEKVALRNIKNCLTKNGKTYIEFRNELFAAFSMNKYSADFFLNELIELEKLIIPSKELFEI